LQYYKNVAKVRLLYYQTVTIFSVLYSGRVDCFEKIVGINTLLFQLTFTYLATV